MVIDAKVNVEIGAYTMCTAYHTGTINKIITVPHYHVAQQ